MGPNEKNMYKEQFEGIVQKRRETRAHLQEQPNIIESPEKLASEQEDGSPKSASMGMQPFFSPDGISYLVAVIICSICSAMRLT